MHVSGKQVLPLTNISEPNWKTHKVEPMLVYCCPSKGPGNTIMGNVMKVRRLHASKGASIRIVSDLLSRFNQ